MQGNPSRRGGALRSGVLTGLSTIAVSGSAAVSGALLSRHFGHGVKTDGFFAAYAVYLVVVLIANSLRVVVLPRLARAREAGTLGGEVVAWATALALPIVPVLALALVGEPGWIARALTSDAAAQRSAASLLPWLVPAAAAQVFAGRVRERARGARRLRHGSRAGLRRRRARRPPASSSPSSTSTA